MNDFDPGEGWMNVQLDPSVPLGAAAPGTVAFREDDGSWSYWVRPDLELPTEPHTVIRVAWALDMGHSDLVLAGTSHKWVNWISGIGFDPNVLSRRIIGFEVLSEPRAVTAKAVLDRVRSREHEFVKDTRVLDGIAREFGVES